MELQFIGQDLPRLTELITSAVQNISFEITRSADNKRRLQTEIADIKRFTWFGLGWFNKEITKLEIEIEEIQRQRMFRQSAFNQLLNLAAELKLQPTQVTLSDDDARLINYWANRKCSVSS